MLVAWGLFAMLRRAFLTGIFAASASPAFAGLFSSTDSGTLSITVDISTQSMTVKNGWRTIYDFDVSTGRKGYSTPTGSFRPIRMHKMWYSSKYENSPMPWSIFFHGGYAIHGTEDLKHLGQIASHGCVRLDPRNAKKLFDLVEDYGMKNAKILITA
jgi:lipoprotein-anchoring transpeptidase ErfK/SrfK